MKIEMTPIAIVKNTRTKAIDDNWENIFSEIILADHIPIQSFNSILDFSHLEIIYYFDKVGDKEFIFSGHPRENLLYPSVGIFGQRKKDRPNKIGICTVQLLEQNGRTIKVKYLDAIDGTPILDIKPVFKEFQPKGEIKQPEWLSNLMKNYW